ncbi:probable O-methyltransferase 3 isoform X1 [Hibiscus syriacus]|nr:probable O-methyltransferase 3 isoform X1 [Hibiscus syriacus]
MDKVNVNGENVNELLQAHNHVWNHIFNFINPVSLKCAVELGIPDIIQNHGKPMTVTELVAALPTLNPTKACNIYRLMRILVHSGFFAQKKLSDDSQEDGYVLTNASRLLLKDNPLSVIPLLKAALVPVLTKPLDFLGIWFQNNDYTPFDIAHGKTFWEYASHDPKLGNSFNEAMASDARLVSSVLIDKCKGSFEGLNSLVDVGGGTGTLGKAIADAFPNLEYTVFDLPRVVADQEDSGNLKYVGGDMFEDVPVADAVLLKSILHNWNDDECLKILKRCKEAISNQAKGVMIKKKVIIIDMVLMENDKANDETLKSIETQLFFDMLMMVLHTGRERREEEWSNLFSAAGFSDYKITPILGLRSLIEVYP